MRQAISVPRASLISLGVCLGKFSKTEKFRLHITALDVLARHAKHKVRLIPLSSSSLDVSRELSYVEAGVGKVEWRDAVPVREPRRQGAPGQG